MHYKRWRHYNNVSGKRCQKILTLCSANLAVSVSTAMSHTRTVLSSEKLATCLPSNRKSDRCVAFSWPSNVLKIVFLQRWRFELCHRRYQGSKVDHRIEISLHKLLHEISSNFCGHRWKVDWKFGPENQFKS